MDAEKIKRYLSDFQERNFKIIEREIRLRDTSKIQTVIGARRAGKTYLLFNKIRKLEKSGVSRKQMIYLNFESPVLNDVSYKEIEDILEIHWSLFSEMINKRLYLFIDEPQVLTNWELAIRNLHDKYNCHIFITGSSSKLLSKEIATALRGRSITTLLLPLSFREFLKFKNVNLDLKRISTTSKAKLISYMDEYILFGGYPEIVLENEKNEKIKILKDYFDLVIYRDVIERYRIKNIKLIKWLLNSLTNSLAKEVSLNNLYLTLKSQGIKVSKNTLYGYFSALEDSFFIYALRKFEYSSKKEGFSIPKVYINDVGFLNLFSLEEYGKRIENIAFLQFLRQKNKRPLLEVNYWKDGSGKEVDFIISEGKKVKSAVQVCYNLSDTKTKNREIKSLLLALKYFKLKEGLIITKSEEGEEKINKKTIRFIPLWKWLLLEFV